MSLLTSRGYIIYVGLSFVLAIKRAVGLLIVNLLIFIKPTKILLIMSYI